MIKEWRQACTRTVPECGSALPGLHLFAWHWQCLGVFLGPPSHPASHTKARDHSTVMGRLSRACPCEAARLHSRLCAQRQVLCCLSSCGGRVLPGATTPPWLSPLPATFESKMSNISVLVGVLCLCCCVAQLPVCTLPGVVQLPVTWRAQRMLPSTTYPPPSSCLHYPRQLCACCWCFVLVLCCVLQSCLCFHSTKWPCSLCGEHCAVWKISLSAVTRTCDNCYAL